MIQTYCIAFCWILTLQCDDKLMVADYWIMPSNQGNEDSILGGPSYLVIESVSVLTITEQGTSSAGCRELGQECNQGEHRPIRIVEPVWLCNWMQAVGAPRESARHSCSCTNLIDCTLSPMFWKTFCTMMEWTSYIFFSGNVNLSWSFLNDVAAYVSLSLSFAFCKREILKKSSTKKFELNLHLHGSLIWLVNQHRLKEVNF